MYKSNSKKKKQMLVLLLIIFVMIITNFNSFFINFNSENSFVSNEFDEKKKLRTADYPTSFDGSGEQINITLHQSYLNNSFNTALDLSDPNNNSILIPCPKDTFFNSSFTKISTEDIYAPNKTLIVEDDSLGVGFETFFITNGYASFTPKGVGYIENISLLIKLIDIVDHANLTIRLYNSENDGGNIRPLSNLGTIVGVSNVTSDTYYWHKITNIHTLFNCSETYSDTFFFRVDRIGGSVYWDWSNDVGSDGIDEMIALDAGESPLLFIGNTIDLPLKIDFVPLNNTPKPSEIELKINNTEVSDEIGNSGYWLKENQEYSDSDGNLDFELTADWWDVTCNISQVQINYTKTDLRASSEFNIAGSGQIVEWNVTRIGGLNYFGTDFDNYQINFTIPATWHNTSIRVFNGSDERTSTITKKLLGNGYREIQIPNAGNGTYWFLNATSDNLLASIDTMDIFNFTDIAHFNATFLTEISDGIINLSVYSPALINNELNYSIKIESFAAGSVIDLTDWDISDNVTQYGDFRVHVYWNNNTAAGFREKIITILGETDLIPSLPKFTFDASETFNIDVFFNDTGLDDGINGADIIYRLDNGAIRFDDLDHGNGTYTITVNCNDADFSDYGLNLIEINASKTYYNNQSEVVEITILGETDLDGSILKSSFDSTETFNVSLFFNDTVKNSGIFGAIRDVYVNSTPYTPISNHDYGDGNYNITIDCDDDVFDIQDYGYFNLSINVEKSYYYNQSTWFIIYITGETSLSATKFPDPIIGYYNSDEIFNITAYFEDVGRNEGINGGQVKVYVKEVSASSYQEYSTTIYPYDIGNYNFTVNCSDPIFRPYGKYNIKINITKSHYYTASEILEEIVVGNTTLTILEPTGTISYVEDETFDIVIEYIDHTQSTGITQASISYTLNGTGYRNDNVVDNDDGTYNITINADDTDFGTNYGNINIIIRANKTYYINLTRTLTFERQIMTQLDPLNPPPLIEVIRGVSIFYTFNYSDKSGNPIEKYDVFQNTTNLQNFEWYLVNDGGGIYTLELNTSKVTAVETPYTLNFNIYTFGNQSQEISFTILITIIQTRIEIESWNENDDFARSTWVNISIDFYFNDTTNDNAITGLMDSDIIIKNYYTGTAWSPGFELFDRAGDGNYKLNISTVGVISGFYTLELSISKFPNYNWSLAYIQFYLRGNYTQIELISISDPGGQLSPKGMFYNFTIFEGSDINIEFNLTDLEYANALILGDVDSYNVWYKNLNTGDNGTLLNALDYVEQTPVYGTHVGIIFTSNMALTPGNYLINITITKINYESTFLTFNLTVVEKYQVELNVTYPEEVNAGDPFTIIVKAEYFNGTEWLPLVGTDFILTPYFNGIASTEIQTKSSNSTGEVLFEITVRREAITMNITIQWQEEYYHIGDTLTISDIDVIPLSKGPTLEDFMPYIIIIGAVAAVGAGSVAIYRGLVVPKKREKKRALTEVRTIFDDAINLEHILVLYKGTGTCVFFKSFGSEAIDPELISGFISAVSSFGKEMVAQKALNEITYGDKMLLLADGEYIRVALVLSKKASIILRKHLTEFIAAFGKTYESELPNWRGQLNVFRNAGVFVDEIFNTSIILPHKITYEFSDVKTLKTPHSKDVLKIAHSCCEEAERDFFFIATLLKEATERTKKDTAEIFSGIKELRDNKILMPIEISTIEARPISQQELNLISQKVAGLISLSPEEKQKLVNDLAQMGPAEREAYFASIMERQEIVSAPMKVGVVKIENLKSAKKEIKNLKKNAALARKENDYDKVITIYQNALMIATNWEIHKEFEELEDLIRRTKIVDFKAKLKKLEKEAKLAAKEEHYSEASQKFRMASRIASEIFKLGVTEMTKEVKTLSNKSKEYEKLI